MEAVVYCRQLKVLAALMLPIILTALPGILPPPTQLFALRVHLVPLLPVLPSRLKAAAKLGNVPVLTEEQRLLVWLLEVRHRLLLINCLKPSLIPLQPIKRLQPARVFLSPVMALIQTVLLLLMSGDRATVLPALCFPPVLPSVDLLPPLELTLSISESEMMTVLGQPTVPVERSRYNRQLTLAPVLVRPILLSIQATPPA
jgi:hypothetical protein